MAPPGSPPAYGASGGGGSHAVSMASLLSSGSGTPHDDGDSVAMPAPPSLNRPRTGLSSLMNSPMDDDVEMEEGEEGEASGDVEMKPLVSISAPASDREEGEEDEDDGDASAQTPQSASDDTPTKLQRRLVGSSIEPRSVEALVLEDPELEALKSELQSAIHKFLSAQGKLDGPAAKRQKKGKQSRRNAAARVQASGEHLAEVERCIETLNDKVATQFDSLTTLSEIVRFCLAFLEEVNEKDSVDGVVVLTTKDTIRCIDFEATLNKVSKKPLYSLLAGVLRRVVACSNSEAIEIVLLQVFDWCLSTTASSPSSWSWLFPLFATIDSYSTQEFLLTQIIKRFYESDVLSIFLPAVEYIAVLRSSETVDIVRTLLGACALSGGTEVRGEPVDSFLRKLVSFAGESSVLVRVCDDSLQFIVTDEFVSALAGNLFSDNAAQVHSNGSSSDAQDWTSLLLQVLEKRSADLSSSGFQLILLLQKLLGGASELSPEIHAAIARFNDGLLQFARSDRSSEFVRGVHRYLPYICKTVLRYLHASTQDQHSTGDSKHYQFWAEWLSLMAVAVSRREVLSHLTEAELLFAEFETHGTPTVDRPISEEDKQLCELLNSITPPSTPDYIEFMNELMAACRSGTSRVRQQRVLVIAHALFTLNGNESAELLIASSCQPVRLSCTSNDGATGASGALEQLVSKPTWAETSRAFQLWKGCCGMDFWEGFLDLSRSPYEDVSARALELLEQTPFLSLEDPVWQHRCLRKLTTTFFVMLRRYREELVVHHGDLSESIANIRTRLQRLKTVLFRLVALEGGVANYPSSVFSTFASQWIDFLLSNHTATSIPTHFPNRINFDRADPLAVPDERVVIRSERTISSRCTNLQSSKVITQVPETLVYRKTLDSSWEIEMDAARKCSMYATDLLVQVLTTTGTVPAMSLSSRILPGDDLCERQVKILIDLLLERVIPCCGIPSDEAYKEFLPNRSSFDVDLRVEQWLNHFPAFLPLLDLLISASASIHSTQSLRLVPVLKSALIVLLGHWNSVKGDLEVENRDVPPYMRNRNQLGLACQLLRLLRATEWVPSPLGKAAELLPLTTPADIRAILFSCWFYLSDHPPRGSRAPTPATSAPSSPVSSGSSPAGGGMASINGAAGLLAAGAAKSLSTPALEFYLIPLRKALHRNIHKVGAKYPLFMC